MIYNGYEIVNETLKFLSEQEERKRKRMGLGKKLAIGLGTAGALTGAALLVRKGRLNALQAAKRSKAAKRAVKTRAFNASPEQREIQRKIKDMHERMDRRNYIIY